jgi:DNA ligase-1
MKKDTMTIQANDTLATMFETLYSGNKNGSVQQWTISVSGSTITKVYGQTGGAMQTTVDTLQSGKNIGRANATSAETQACHEAQSQWEKKLKSGYVRVLSEAQTGAVDAQFVTGGIDVMLAQKFSQHGDKITYPAYLQPKLDGVRCISMLSADGVCTLWSRTRKPITGVPHIARAIEQQLHGRGPIILDGELYQHDYKDRFETIVSFVRQSIPKPGHEVVQYHVYDTVVLDADFETRTRTVRNYALASPLVTVPTSLVDDLGDIVHQAADHRYLGYEGSIVRQRDSFYTAGRSMGLQKIKQFDDSEFVVTGVVSGRGRMSECAIFTCQTNTGKTFACKMEGSLSSLKAYLIDPSLVVGKMLTVRYQGLTNGDVPRFPIGVSVRDYE